MRSEVCCGCPGNQTSIFEKLAMPKNTCWCQTGEVRGGRGNRTKSKQELLMLRTTIRFLHGCGTFLERKRPDKPVKEIIKIINSSAKHNDQKSQYKELPEWKKQKIALHKKFNGEHWNPAKKLSRAEMENVRLLKNNFPHLTATDLSKQFKISPEAIRRVLASKWRPTSEELDSIQDRWKKRGERIKKLHISDQATVLPLKKLTLSSSGFSPSELRIRKTTNLLKSNQPNKKKNGNKMDLLKKKLAKNTSH